MVYLHSPEVHRLMIAFALMTKRVKKYVEALLPVQGDFDAILDALASGGFLRHQESWLLAFAGFHRTLARRPWLRTATRLRNDPATGPGIQNMKNRGGRNERKQTLCTKKEGKNRIDGHIRERKNGWKRTLCSKKE